MKIEDGRYQCALCSIIMTDSKSIYRHLAECSYSTGAKLHGLKISEAEKGKIKEKINKNLLLLFELAKANVSEREEVKEAPIKSHHKEGIPCEICSQVVPLPLYENHIKQCQQKKKEENEAKALEAIIPCEQCGELVSFLKYEEHMKSHKAASPKILPDITLKKTDSSFPIICDICGESIDSKTYIEHYNSHRPPVGPAPEMELPTDEGQLPRITYTKKNELQCVICYVDYMEGDKLIVLPCLHCYHESCILGWIKRNTNPTCPFCEKEIFHSQITQYLFI